LQRQGSDPKNSNMPTLWPACLPKQVLRDILDTHDDCNDSDEPYDYLKTTLLGQFGKSKWQSYFELLRLPMDMQGFKPSVLIPLLWRRHKAVPEPFSYPARRFLHTRDRRCLHRCHRRGPRPVNGHRQRGWTSDLFSFQPRPELGGSPVDTCQHP
jgi:hypothetical protein